MRAVELLLKGIDICPDSTPRKYLPGTRCIGVDQSPKHGTPSQTTMIGATTSLRCMENQRIDRTMRQRQRALPHCDLWQASLPILTTLSPQTRGFWIAPMIRPGWPLVSFVQRSKGTDCSVKTARYLRNFLNAHVLYVKEPRENTLKFWTHATSLFHLPMPNRINWRRYWPVRWTFPKV